MDGHFIPPYCKPSFDCIQLKFGVTRFLLGNVVLRMNLLSEHDELTFRNLAFYTQDGRKITLWMPYFIFIQQMSVLNILNMLYNLHFFLFKMPFIS